MDEISALVSGPLSLQHLAVVGAREAVLVGSWSGAVDGWEQVVAVAKGRSSLLQEWHSGRDGTTEGQAHPRPTLSG